MQSSIIIKGQVIKVLEKEYEGKKSYSIQFMAADAKRGFQLSQLKQNQSFLIVKSKIIQLLKYQLK